MASSWILMPHNVILLGPLLINSAKVLENEGGEQHNLSEWYYCQ